MPQPWQIKVNNWHWQVTTVPAKKNVEEKEEEEEEDGLLPQTLYLYSAHYDDRRRGEEGADRIRILVISDRYSQLYLNPLPPIYTHLLYVGN